MRYAIIENTKVINIIEAEKMFADEIGAIAVGDIGVGIGDDYINGMFKVRNVEGVIVDVPPINVIDRPEPPSLKENLENLERENKKLKSELEVTQAVVDELLFGGAL